LGLRILDATIPQGSSCLATLGFTPQPRWGLLTGSMTRNMSAEFPYDVFLSHSAKDKGVVRPLAERLQKDGLKVWFDEWVLKPGDSIPAKIEAVLPHFALRSLAFSLQLLPSTPLNQERRFIPLRLDDDSP
jgi:hypothetical protein